MKAAIRTKYGGPKVIQITELERPVPRPDEILVKVYAATVNRTDCAVLKGSPFIMRFFTGLFGPNNSVLGTDFAGVIEAVGRDIRAFEVGEKIFGFQDNGLGSHAEFTTISEDMAFSTMPELATFEEAVASLEGFHYAYNFINKTNLNSYHSVLVNGASGAIGSAAVQIAKYYEAHVTAVCDAKSIDRVKALGADQVIDYTKEDFTQIGQSYDFIFDTVGKSSFAKCKPILKPGGIYISSELGFMGQNLILSILKPFTGSRKIFFPLPTNIPGSIDFVKELFQQGKFKPLIDRSYPLDETADAFCYVERGQKVGNVILKIRSDD